MFCWKYCSSEYFCASFCLNTCCGVSWHLGVGFLGYAVTLCLTFWGTATLFARMACTTLHSHRQSGNFTFPPAIWGRFQFLHSESESEVAQSCPTLCDPMDCSLPGSSIHGIFQARVLEWVAISFSRGSSWPRDRIRASRIAGRRFTVWATREVQ